MKDIRQYILNATRTYHYLLRTVHPIDDAALSKIEDVLLRYEPLDMSAPRETIFQASPLDFVNVAPGKVYLVDFETAFPARPDVLEREIADALGLKINFVVVRTPNDPRELETERLNALAAIKDEAGDLRPDSLLATAATYPEVADVDADSVYGDAYNKRFLGYLAAAEAEKVEASKVEAPEPLFTWLDHAKPEKAADFNADFDTVKPVDATGKTALETPHDPSVSPYGNETGVGRSLRRVYKSMSGKAKVIEAKPKAD